MENDSDDIVEVSDDLIPELVEAGWNPNALVVKSNDLLTAKTNLTLNELRIILIAISKIDSRAETEVGSDKIYWVSAKELNEIGSERSKAYKYLQNAVKTLYNRSVIRRIGSSGKEQDEFRWIQKVSTRKGVIGLRFSEDILPFLTRIRSNFIRYPIKQISELKSVFTMRFFELCVRWRGTGPKRLSMEELKETLNISPKKLNGDVARIVRECAQKINEASLIDFHVDYNFVRTGRKFTHIVFTVSSRSSTLPAATFVHFTEEDQLDMTKQLFGYQDEDYRNLKLSDKQRQMYADLLSNFEDPIGRRFYEQYIRKAGNSANSQLAWRDWIEAQLTKPKFIEEIKVYLHDLGFVPTSAQKITSNK